MATDVRGTRVLMRCYGLHIVPRRKSVRVACECQSERRSKPTYKEGMSSGRRGLLDLTPLHLIVGPRRLLGHERPQRQPRLLDSRVDNTKCGGGVVSIYPQFARDQSKNRAGSGCKGMFLDIGRLYRRVVDSPVIQILEPVETADKLGREGDLANDGFEVHFLQGFGVRRE